MASYVQQSLLAVLVLAVLVANANGSDLILGKRLPGDQLACYGTVDLPGQPGRIVDVTRVCKVPSYLRYITAINAYDTGATGKGGSAQVTEGGVGYKSVTLHLKSQPSQPLNFSFNIFGMP